MLTCRLTIAAEDYHAYVSRKIHSEALPGETKMMHTEALGVVMIAHGEELGDESPLGTLRRLIALPTLSS